MHNYQTGDAVLIVCKGRSVRGEVVFASGNGVSLMLGFEAVLDGHVGMMPVLRDDSGAYQSIMNGVTVTLSPR